MTRLGCILALVLAWVGPSWLARAQQAPQLKWTIQPLVAGEGGVVFENGIATASSSNGVLVTYGEAVLTAQQVAVNQTSGDVLADGDVRVQQGDQFYVSQHLRFNFYTHQMEAEQFRTGQTPIFAAGKGLHADLTNQVYTATNALLTTDNVADPDFKVVARRITIYPGKKIEAHDAVLYLKGVPVFYFPYYTRNLGEHASQFNFTPGYRSRYGPFVLGNYTWYINEALEAVLHADYREARGPGVGPDLNYRLGPWGEGSFKYYYTHDNEPNIDHLGVPISEDRQRVWASYQANPATNLYIKGMARYESDLAVVRDFFEPEYRLDPQPNSFLEVNKFWQNFSVDAYVQPRLNEFLQTIERLPDIKITGYRQEIGNSPFYYESETSAGYYRFLFAENAGVNGPPPGLNYEAGRADTFHQVLLPETFFGWLNVTPRVGGRFTYYTEASGPGGTNDEAFRGVFNTGAEVTFKASRVWPGMQNDFFEINGLRHIIEPSANYVFVPSPTTPPSQLPQFDSELPSFRLLPIDFPDYNAIDSIDSQNVIRWGLHNKLQTKREGQVVNVVNWNVYTDWRLKPNSNQTTFADLYSDATFRPWRWLTFESLTRYDLSDDLWRMSYSTVTIQPNNVWSWQLGHYYLRNQPSPPPTALGNGNNVFTSTLQYRLNENWGLRMGHYFEARTGQLQEQDYTVFRDMRSWTAALSFLVRQNQTGPDEFGVAFTFSLKAYPRPAVTTDAGRAYSLLGG